MKEFLSNKPQSVCCCDNLKLCFEALQIVYISASRFVNSLPVFFSFVLLSKIKTRTFVSLMEFYLHD